MSPGSNDPSWMMVGVRRAPEHAHQQAANGLSRMGAHSEHAVERGNGGGPVAWQPPHRQDEDLVPLTAGACSPRRRSSRRIPRQTSGPDSSPRDGRGAASRRHRAPPEPDPTPLPDGRPLGSLGEAALSCRCIDSQPTWVAAGRASTSGPGVGASIKPSSDWHHCHRRSGQRPIRPAVSDPLVGPPQSEGGRRRRGAAALATLHKCSLAWPGSPRAAVLGG
jgi:hypothetical protein